MQNFRNTQIQCSDTQIKENKEEGAKKKAKKTTLEQLKISFLNNKIILNQIQEIQNQKDSQSIQKQKSCQSQQQKKQISQKQPFPLKSEINPQTEEKQNQTPQKNQKEIEQNELHQKSQQNLFSSQKISHFKSLKSHQSQNQNQIQNINYTAGSSQNQSPSQKPAISVFNSNLNLENQIFFQNFNADQERRKLAKRLTFLHKLKIEKLHDDDCYFPIITDQQKIEILENYSESIQYAYNQIDSIQVIESDLIFFLTRIQQSHQMIIKQVSITALGHMIPEIFKDCQYLKFLVLDKNRKVLQKLKINKMLKKLFSQNLEDIFNKSSEFTNQKQQTFDQIFQFVIYPDIKQLQICFADEERRIIEINLNQLKKNMVDLKDDMTETQAKYIDTAGNQEIQKQKLIFKLNRTLNSVPEFSFKYQTELQVKINMKVKQLEKNKNNDLRSLKYFRQDSINTFNLTNKAIKNLKQKLYEND